MNRTLHAVRIGLHRGRIEFGNSLHNPGDVAYYLYRTAIFIAVLYNLRNDTIEGTTTSVAVLMFPGLLVMSTAISPLLGLATVVATEREDGTLLRYKALPHGT